ncbi:Mor transcription activator family protein [Escherichia coli]
MDNRSKFECSEYERKIMEHMDNVSVKSLVCKWPKSIQELIGLLEQEFRDNGIDDPYRLACKVAMRMAWYFGGRQFYLPRGKVLQQAIQNNLIYRQFNGKNISKLAKTYSLAETTIYQIIAEQRAIARSEIR